MKLMVPLYETSWTRIPSRHFFSNDYELEIGKSVIEDGECVPKKTSIVVSRALNGCYDVELLQGDVRLLESALLTKDPDAAMATAVDTLIAHYEKEQNAVETLLDTLHRVKDRMATQEGD